MKRDEYLQQRNLIRCRIDQLRLDEAADLLPRFHITSANLLHFLPEMPVDHHEVFFKELLFHQKLSMLEQSFYDITEMITHEHLDINWLNSLKERPAIICTFHTGSYRAINTFLVRHGISYQLVVSGEIARLQGQDYLYGHQKITAGGTGTRFGLIDAEKPTAVIAMLRALRKGESLLVYVDGATGTYKDDHKKCIDIAFFKANLFVRTGIPFIAFTAGAAIMPVICYRTSPDDIRLRFVDPIVKLSSEQREEFIRRAITKIYADLESVLFCYPEQWEAWLYLHHSMVLPNPSPDLQPSSHVGLFKISDEYYLFDKLNYKTYLINSVHFSILSNANKAH